MKIVSQEIEKIRSTRRKIAQRYQNDPSKIVEFYQSVARGEIAEATTQKMNRISRIRESTDNS